MFSYLSHSTADQLALNSQPNQQFVNNANNPGGEYGRKRSFPTVSTSPGRTDRATFRDTKDHNIKVTLENKKLWNEFGSIGTEMIMTKCGRRMFPTFKVSMEGLNPNLKYFLFMDVIPMDDYRYKYHNSEWVVTGKSEPHIPGRLYIHPDSPATGDHWMKQSVSFHKLKLTNNILDKNGHIILNSLHKYLPRMHVVQTDDVRSVQWSSFSTFTFDNTSFIAVTAYQNERIIKLKVDHNPYAKAFRENTATVKRDTKINLKRPKPDETDSQDRLEPAKKIAKLDLKVVPSITCRNNNERTAADTFADTRPNYRQYLASAAPTAVAASYRDHITIPASFRQYPVVAAVPTIAPLDSITTPQTVNINYGIQRSNPFAGFYCTGYPTDSFFYPQQRPSEQTNAFQTSGAQDLFQPNTGATGFAFGSGAQQAVLTSRSHVYHHDYMRAAQCYMSSHDYHHDYTSAAQRYMSSHGYQNGNYLEQFQQHGYRPT